MARIYKESRYVLQLLIGKSYGAQYEDVKIFFYTKNPSNQVMAGDEITIKGNIAEVKIGSALFDNLEDGLIKYIVYGTKDGIPFIEERQSNYFLKTPLDFKPSEKPDEDITCNLGEGDIYLTTNDAGTYELYASDDGYDGWSKFYVTLENGGAIKIHKAEDLVNTFNNGEQIDFGAYYYVGGKITEIQEVSMEWGNATYTLDNGFKVYRGDWYDGNPFTSEDQIKVGAYIAVYGIIQNYNGTLQFKAHSQVIAYKECEGGEVVSCNLEDKGVNPSINDRDGNGVIVITPSENYDGLLRVVLDPTTIFNEGVEEGRNQGEYTYPTIRDIYNTEEEDREVLFKGTIAVCLQNKSTKYMVVTDYTGAIYVTTSEHYPDDFCEVGNECIFRGVVKKSSKTNMRHMTDASIYEVLSRGNYVVMPTDAVELTNKDELYVPDEYGNAEMKYLYYQGEITRIVSSSGNITISTPESVSAEGKITLRAAKEEWRYNLVVGDYVRAYMFTTISDGYFLPTDIIKLGTEGACPSAQEQVNEYYYCPLILGDSEFGEAAKNWNANMVTFNNYDGTIIEDKLYVPTFGNKNEFRTKEKAKFVQNLPDDVSVLGSIEFGAGIEYIRLLETKEFTNLTNLTIGPDMNTVDFGTSAFPVIKEIWSYSTTSEINVYFSLGPTFNGVGTLYLKNKDHETEWKNKLPSDWTIVYI